MRKIIESRGLQFEVPHEVYTPREDSFMVIDELVKHDLPSSSIAEIGPGTGIISLSLAKRSDTVIAADISYAAARQSSSNARTNGFGNYLVIAGDLVRAFRKQSLPRTIIFNPPYLPEDPEVDPYSPRYELNQLVGGKNGYETLSNLLYDLNPEFHVVYTIISSLATNPVEFAKIHPKWTSRVLTTENMGFETIWLIRMGDFN